jgi:uncharacterized protein (TIGR01615 family)
MPTHEFATPLRAPLEHFVPAQRVSGFRIVNASPAADAAGAVFEMEDVAEVAELFAKSVKGELKVASFADADRSASSSTGSFSGRTTSSAGGPALEQLEVLRKQSPVKRSDPLPAVVDECYAAVESLHPDPVARMKALARELEQRGYKFQVMCVPCPSSYNSQAFVRRHAFLMDPESSVVIDPNLKDEFEIARTTPEYQELLSRLPRAFVGPKPALVELVELVCREMSRALTVNGLSVPPWRKKENTVARWVLATPYDEQMKAQRAKRPRVIARQRSASTAVGTPAKKVAYGFPGPHSDPKNRPTHSSMGTRVDLYSDESSTSDGDDIALEAVRAVRSLHVM